MNKLLLFTIDHYELMVVMTVGVLFIAVVNLLNRRKNDKT